MKVFVTGCPGIGKTTLRAHLAKQYAKYGEFEDADKTGFRGKDDHWYIDIDYVRQKIGEVDHDYFLFGMAHNVIKVGNLNDWDKKIALVLPWDLARQRIRTRLLEHKNTFPANEEEWRKAENCHKGFRYPGFTVLDARGTVDQLARNILNSCNLL